MTNTQNDPFAGFGAAKDNFGGYENFKLKDGEAPFVFAIFPPMKSCAATGEWALYWGQHFGYKGRGEKDPTKLYNRPFLCLEERDWQKGQGMTTFQDAIDEIIKAKEDAKEALVNQLKAAGVAEKEIYASEEYKKLSDWLYDHSVDRKHRLLVMDQQGRYGVLRITHTCMKTLREKKKALAQEGFSMIPEVAPGAKGVWMAFSRTGTGRFTTDTVEPLRETELDDKGRKIQIIKEWEFTPEVASQAFSILPDLKELRDSYRISPEQIQRLADLGDSPDPDEVDSVMGPRNGSDRGEEPRPAPVTPAATRAPAVTKAAAATKTVAVTQPAAKLSRGGEQSVLPPATPAVAPPVEDDEEAQLLAALAAARAKKAKAQAPQAQQAPQKAEAEVAASGAPDPDFDPVEDDEAFDAIFNKKG